MDAVGWFYPIHFAHGDIPCLGFSAVAELDIKEISAQDHGDAMKGIAMPRCRLAGRQALSADQVISAMV